MAEIMHDWNRRTHRYISDILAYKLTDEDFEIIQAALIERADLIEEIDNSKVKPDYVIGGGGKEMCLPRRISEGEKIKMKMYADCHCADTILRVIAEYCEFYSKE